MTEETKFKLFCASNDNTYSKLPAQYGLIARDLYKDGADWYRNNVWHNWDEEPETDKEVLFVCSEGIYAGKYLCGINVKAGPFSVNHHPDELGNGKWAYIEDLLPDNYINKEKEA